MVKDKLTHWDAWRNPRWLGVTYPSARKGVLTKKKKKKKKPPDGKGEKINTKKEPAEGKR
jgi:hypothetical protein